jgi:hypothetical protein
MLTDTPKTVFDDSYSCKTPEHDFAYRKLLAMHEAGGLSVLRIWNTLDHHNNPKLLVPEDAKSTTVPESSVTVLKTPRKLPSHSRRRPSVHLVDMIDAAALPSARSSVSSDSVYQAHTPSKSVSPSRQLLEG